MIIEGLADCGALFRLAHVTRIGGHQDKTKTYEQIFKQLSIRVSHAVRKVRQMETDITAWVMGFLHPMALLTAMVFLISLIKRRTGLGSFTDYAIGGVFSCALVYSMAEPIDLGGSTGIFDMRCLLIGAATALISPRAGIIVLCTGIAYRTSIGGNGVVPGVAGMVIAFAGALMWRQWVAHRGFSFPVQSLSLALLISLHAFSILLAPAEVWLPLTTTLVPYMVLVNVLGIVIIKSLLSNELNFLSDAETQRQHAQRDHLTGLLNRKSLEEGYANLKLGGAGLDGMATIYFDIDNFKAINDVNGHLFGDAALKIMGERLLTVLRPGDLFCRLGGDEFVIVLDGVQLQEAQLIAERCRLKIASEEVYFEGNSVPVTISVGAIWSRAAFDMNESLGLADQALYEAKRNGRNVVVFKNINSPDLSGKQLVYAS